LAQLPAKGKARMTCHYCRVDCQRFGKHRNGLQRFRCNSCGKTFTEPHEQITRAEEFLREEKGLLALRLICEGNSVRSTSRITGLHHRTVLQIVAAAAERCENLFTKYIRNVPVNDVQCDEIWGFVYKKRGNRHGGEQDFAYIGDAWTWVAIERHTKLVLSYELGKRTVTSASSFMRKLAEATSPDQRFQLTTDGLAAYNYAVGNELEGRVDYAQLIKIYDQAPPEEARRYSPAHLAEAIPTPVYGDPDEKRICTSHVERQNLTMRMCMRRLTRLTNGFSKKWDGLKAALALHFAYYNFCRPHQTLKGATPAMAAGIAVKAYSLGELLAEAA
jgi:transposase-like protein/IS1 family transposase